MPQNLHSSPFADLENHRRIFTHERGFSFEHNHPQPLWCSPQIDIFSCGLRTYDIMKTLLMRLSEAFHNRLLDQQAYTPAMWGPMNSDVQVGKYRPFSTISLHPSIPLHVHRHLADPRVCFPDKIRAEMIGVLAWEAMRHQGFNARIFLGPLRAQRDTFWDQGVFGRGTTEASLQHPVPFPVATPHPEARRAARAAGADLLF